MARRGAAAASCPQDEDPQMLSYLQPEILPVQIMIDVLQERGMKAAVLQQVGREKIIHLFYKYISPKYQRDYRDNRRGRAMKKLQERRAIRLKDDDWKALVTESKGKTSLGLSPKIVSNNVGERLKPPPSCINTEKKVIKLGGTAPITSAGDLDFVIIKRKNSECSETETSTKKQKLPNEKRKSETSEANKDDHKNDTAHVEPMDNNKKPKLDRKPITWP